MAEKMKTPWRNNEELRRFWALARRYGGDDFVYDTIYLRYGAQRLHEIARDEFLDLLAHMEGRRQPRSSCTCGVHHGAAQCGQYRRIMWLKSRLGWDDAHLAGFIKKYAHIDSIRFLTAPKARGIITGMEKMLRKEACHGEG